MKNVFLLLFVLISMTACQKRNKTFHIDQELMPLYTEFLEAGYSRGQNVSTDDLIMRIEDVVQKDPKGAVLAYCRTGVSSIALVGLTREVTETPLVIVDRKFYEKASPESLHTTVTHELTHCLMGQGHRNQYGKYTFQNGTTKYQVPTSMMNMYSIFEDFFYQNPKWYAELKESYLDEIFGLKSSALTGLASSTVMNNLKSSEKIVFESVSREEGCDSSVKVMDIDEKSSMSIELENKDEEI